MNRASLLLSAALAVTPQLAHAAPGDGAAAAAVPLVERAHVQRFALVIGSNHTLDRKQAPLRYADDDALKLAAALREAGVEVTTAVRLDHDSQAQHPDATATTEPATRAGVRAAWTALRERMDAAKAAGAQVELLLFYSGHGDVGPDGQGFLTLDDGKFTRADLFGEVLATSPAAFNHVLVDACRSEQFVLSRGRGRWRSDQAEGGYGDAVKRYLDSHHLGAFPNTGVIVAHSVDQQTHEWERYHGGIFTHELVSGLRGGADLNGDGHIEYSELGAFVSSANSSVEDPRARLQVVVRPPAGDERRALLVHEHLDGARILLVTGDGSELWTLEDEHGVRIADVRRSGERPGWLRLPAGDLFVARERPGEGGTSRQEARIAASQGGVVLAHQLEFSSPTQQARGALDQALRAGLFATPFGPGYYAGFVDRTGLLPVRESSWNDAAWAQRLAAAQPEPVPAPGPAAVPPPVVAAPVEPTAATPAVKRETPRWAATRSRWGSVHVGAILTPFGRTAGSVDGWRVISNGFVGPERAPEWRGLDLRWQYFSLRDDDRFPRWIGYFRSGYTAGAASFASAGTPAAGDATKLSYVAVPLFLGGSFYPFAKFPLRPFLGLGAGFDVLRLAYRRHERAQLRDVSARIGFELHAGLEVRITNYVALTAEIMQLWSARRRLAGVPDFSHEGFTILTGVSAGFPLTRADAAAVRRSRRASKR
ncbi:MAG: caspase family protein [Nannocystaceae bacterium]|nr:caspase family protein [Nannocystaceae bacterium]